MPWHNLRKITKQDLLEFNQPSGDKIYALSFEKIIENFEYLKDRIYVGTGTPNLIPYQSVAIYFDIANKQIYIWNTNSWVLMTDTNTSNSKLNELKKLTFFIGVM